MVCYGMLWYVMLCNVKLCYVIYEVFLDIHEQLSYMLCLSILLDLHANLGDTST